MPCYSPLTAWLDYGHLTKSGKPSVVFRGSSDPLYKPVTVPCGQCIGCRLEYSRKWAIRCTHEASLYDRNCFITLTYDDRSVMYDKNLHLEHLQKFFKRLRKNSAKVFVISLVVNMVQKWSSTLPRFVI